MSDNAPGSVEKREALRLDEQHRCFIRNLGYLLHPAITARLPKDARVADIGCGTGVFLVDLAPSLAPSAQLAGFDITAAQFLEPENIPPNISLHVHDATQPWPAEHHHQYDVAVIRVLVGRISRDAWYKIGANAFQILKPGGAIQWLEPNLNSIATVLRSHATSSTSHLQRATDLLRKGRVAQRNDEWALIPETLAAIGFRDIIKDVVSSDRIAETRERYTRSVVEGQAVAQTRMAKAEAPGALSMEEAQDLIKGMQTDVDSGAYLRMDLHTTVGFVP